MSFLSKLAKWGPMIAGIAATPFTGGTSLLGTLGIGAKAATGIAGAAGALGKVAGGVSAGKAKGRADEATLEGQLADRYNQNALANSKQKLQANTQRRGQLAGVDLSSHLNPLTDPRASKFGQPSGLSPETLSALKSQTMHAMSSGSDVPQLRDPAVPQAGKTDSILNALSLGGTVAGGLKEAGVFQPKPQMPSEQQPQQMGQMPNLGIPGASPEATPMPDPYAGPTLEELLKQRQGGYA